MKLKKLGIEWGACYDIARPFTVTTESGEACLIYEGDSGDTQIELPPCARIEIGKLTIPGYEGQTGIVITITDC